MAHMEDGDHEYRLSTGFEALSIETQFSDIEDDSYKTELVATTPPRLSIDVQQPSADSPISMASFDLDNPIASHNISRDEEKSLEDMAAETKQPEVLVGVVDLHSGVDLDIGIDINDDGFDLDGASDILRKVLTREPHTPSIPPPNTSPLPNTGPVSAEGSVTSYGSNDDEWDKAQLLAMSDEVRATLKSSTVPPGDLERLDDLLREFLSDESSPNRAMEFSVIVHARLDKLLEALLYIKWNATQLDIPFQLTAAKATSLQRKWQQRFGANYFLIPETRINEMKTSGALKGVALDPGERKNSQRWLVFPNPIAKCEGDLNFQLGDWWLNLSCAFRDGIVGSVDEIVSQGQYGITSLPMLTGTEVGGQTVNTSTYIREGTMNDIHLSLMTQVGRTVRVLRGHALKSRHAPEAGIRYDGMYRVIQYGHKLDHRSEKYRLELTLERVKSQTSMNELSQIPKPSQHDDWQVYRHMIGDDVRPREGALARREWVFEDQEHWRESEEWKRQMDSRLDKYASG